MTKSAIRNPRSAIAWIALAALALAAYFLRLTMPFVGPDEPRYAQVAREMYERGDLVTPTLGGYPWFEKPPLLYWLEIVSYNIFGVSEFAARLGPALCGLGTIASLWILGNAVSKNEGQGPRTDLANYFALITASTLGIVVFSHGASFDIVITFTLTALLVAFYIFDRTGRHRPLIAFYLFIGLSVLAKGLIGIVFPFAIVAFYYLLERRFPARSFLISLLWGTLLALLIASVWYIPMYSRHGWTFIDEFFVQHHFARFTSNKYQHPQPFYFFVWVFPLMILPWAPLFFASLWSLVKVRFHRGDAEKQRSLLLFSLSWLLVPLVFFSFSGSKLPGYVLPAVPAAVIVVTLFVTRFIYERAWRYSVLAIAGATFAMIAILLVAVVPKFADADSVSSLLAAGNERGLATSKVLTLHTISHNAEFYAAGRLLRDEEGKQKKLYGTNEVIAEIERGGGKPVLVLVPLEYLSQLMRENRLHTEVLRNNDELAIAAVSLK